MSVQQVEIKGTVCADGTLVLDGPIGLTPGRGDNFLGESAVIVYLDTNCVIYFVEQNPLWHAKIVTRIAALRAAGDTLAVSDLTQAEVIVLPFRNADAVIEASDRAFFADQDITVFPITQPVCEGAAQLRAVHTPFKQPDALHLAAAIEHGCGLFLTGEARLAACTEIPVEVLK